MTTYVPTGTRRHVPPSQEQQQAAIDGYGQLTESYTSQEMFMLERVCDDLDRQHIGYRLVRDEDGTQVWRKNLRILPKH